MKWFQPWWKERVGHIWRTSASNARGGLKLRGLIVYFEPTNWVVRLSGITPKELDAEPQYGYKDSLRASFWAGHLGLVGQANGKAGKNERIGFVVIVVEGGRIFFSGTTRELVNYHNRLSLR